MKIVYVFRYDENHRIGSRPPVKAGEFQVWINKTLDSIPREFFDSANVDISATSDYDEAYLDVQIYYYRPETAEEIAEEMAKVQAMIDSKQKDELDTFLRLKEKFEGKGESK